MQLFRALRFYGGAIRQLPLILGWAWLTFIALITSIGSTLAYFGIKRGKLLVGWWESLSPWWGAVLPVVLLAIALFLIAVHRQFQQIEQERDKLQAQNIALQQRVSELQSIVDAPPVRHEGV